MSGLREVRSALYSVVTSDATIMGRLGSRGPQNRLGKDSPHSRSVAALTFEGATALAPGSKEEQTVTMHVYAFSRDLVDDVVSDLLRLFHPSPRRMWKGLTVTGARVFIRREFEDDIPDPASELWHKALRFRLLFASAA